MSASLVGSEMCIRDRFRRARAHPAVLNEWLSVGPFTDTSRLACSCSRRGLWNQMLRRGVLGSVRDT
eukprot:14003997-Alexandrium_andersonii.AAC.1